MHKDKSHNDLMGDKLMLVILTVASVVHDIAPPNGQKRIEEAIKDLQRTCEAVIKELT